jgi:hypothetical protein
MKPTPQSTKWTCHDACNGGNEKSLISVAARKLMHDSSTDSARLTSSGRLVANWEVTPFFAHCHVGW